MFVFKGIKLPKITGIALWPFIFLKPNLPSETLINHEKIHLRQQLEMLIIPFYLWYLTEWFILLIVYRDFDKAYLNICFEKEAFAHDKDLAYLKKRKPWAFYKYY